MKAPPLLWKSGKEEIMISSMGNGRIKRIVRLKEKNRERTRENVFLAEGMKMFEEAPIEKVKEIYIEEKRMKNVTSGPLFDKLEKCRVRGALIETVAEEVFQKMSDTISPQGILCVMESFSYDGEDMVRRGLERRQGGGPAPLFLILENIQDPGNLGTMVRTAEGAGADGIFMSRETVDIYNPKVIRATMGSLYRMPFCYMENLKEGIELLQKYGITVYAAHLKGKKFFHEIDYSGGSAFLIGNEGSGLKAETADMADSYLKIPMAGKLESLNAATAAALLMYQSRISQQRKDLPGKEQQLK